MGLIRCSVLRFPPTLGGCEGFLLFAATSIAILIIVVVVYTVDDAVWVIDLLDAQQGGSAIL